MPKPRPKQKTYKKFSIRDKKQSISHVGNLVAFDTETTGLRSWGSDSEMLKFRGYYPARPFAFSFCDTDGNTHYERLSVDLRNRKVVEPRNWDGRKRMQELFDNSDVTLVLHNAAFDLHMIEKSGYTWDNEVYDTMFLAHIVTGGSEFTYGLKELSEKYLGVSKNDQTDLIADVKKKRSYYKQHGGVYIANEYFGRTPEKADYWLAEPELCKKYAILDAERTMMLWLLLEPKLDDYPNMRELFKTEMQLMEAVRAMEWKGVRIYQDRLKELDTFYRGLSDKYVKKAYELGLPASTKANAPKQLAKYFYDIKGYKKTYTPKGNYKCNNEVLYKIVEEHEDVVADALLEFRSCQYAIRNFMIPYTRSLILENGEWSIHPSYRQCGPVTGRFSASDPNLMTVASGQTFRTKSQVRMRNREIFGPRKNHVWYMPDFKQMEVWVFALFSGEPKMIEILQSGKDFHQSISEEIWKDSDDYYYVYCYECMKTHDGRKTSACPHCHNESPTTLFANKKLYRQLAKLIMFCRLYGGGIGKVAQLAKINREEAKKFVNQYNEALPGVATYQERVCYDVSTHGYLQNPFGRVYFLTKAHAYKGVNYMIQGTCADLMKRAMIRVHRLFLKRWPGCQMLLTMHDEVICEIPLKYHCKKLMREIIEEMQKDSDIIKAPVPMPIDMEITHSVWSEKTEVKL